MSSPLNRRALLAGGAAAFGSWRAHSGQRRTAHEHRRGPVCVHQRPGARRGDGDGPVFGSYTGLTPATGWDPARGFG